MIRVLDARFVTTAVEPAGYPDGKNPEVAFAGRSNVGKSSMINALAGRKKLVRVSNTPGRTRTLNFFDVDLEVKGGRRTFRLCDLPGYGFARASKADRRDWQEMIAGYVEKRFPLRLVVSIIDAEVGPSEDDAQLLGYLTGHGKKVLVVATKIDRIPKAKRKPRLHELARMLQLPTKHVLPFSAVEKLGVDDTWRTLADLMG
ncbi:MAG: YihA family ribosome biogenesis GTP-binding protein [Deltaproteobacteria bacterium]|nr:YihA family ribosome biogenesis GTP-binding protein [Deltaproteobacteria bacterium]